MMDLFQKKTTKPQPTGMQDPSWKIMLSAVPVRNVWARSETTEDNELILAIRREKPRYLVPPVSWVIKPSLTKRVIIDAVGMQLWKSCDGNMTVENIIDDFALRYDLTFHEARASVTGYLRSLIRHGVLAIAMK